MAIVKSIYYLLLFALITGSTLVVPIFLAEESELSRLNAELDHLKSERGTQHLDLDDPETRAILDQGTVYFKDEYVTHASRIAIVICAVSLVLVYLFKNANKHDPLYILSIFTILALIGAIKVTFFIAIVAICTIGYIVKIKEQTGTE